MIKKYTILFAATAIAAFFQTFMLKANIGVAACWDAVSMNLYEICGLKVGTGSIVLGCTCIFIQFLLLGKKFSPLRLMQVPISLLYGNIMNLFYYHVLTFDVESYWVRMLLCIISTVGLAVFLGIVTCMNLVQTPAEGLCYVLSSKFNWDFGRIRAGIDILCVVISVMLSLAFGLSFKIREGTLLSALFLGILMGWCMKKEKPILEKICDKTEKNRKLVERMS